MQGKSAEGDRGYGIFFCAQPSRAAGARHRGIRTGRQSELRTERSKEGAGDGQEQAYTGSRAPPDAAEVAQRGGSTHLPKKKIDSGTGIRSSETTTRATTVSI